MKKPKFSLRQLAKKHGVDRATATKVCAGVKTEAEATAALEAWKKQRQAPANIDPETGLSWWQARQREATLRERQKRESERQAQGGEYIRVQRITELVAIVRQQLNHLALDICSGDNSTWNERARAHAQLCINRMVGNFEYSLRTWVEGASDEAQAEAYAKLQRASNFQNNEYEILKNETDSDTKAALR